MENNDSNLKPQPTGGLKLMTVFIAVLALHVVVIGGFTVYHLMSGGTTDADLLSDKTHKDAKTTDSVVINDSSLPQAASPDKSPATPAAPADVASTPANAQTPPPDQTASTGTVTPAPTPAIAANPTPAPSTPAPVEMAVTPVDIAPVPAPSAPVASGPVKMPVVAAQPDSTPITNAPYVVKSHDSLARIAHQNHTSVAKLKAANDLKTDVLQIGQKLVIPGATQVASASGTTATPDASLNPTTLSDPPTGPIMGTSTTAKTKPATAGITAKTSPAATATADLQHHLYTVVKGDTLTRIAHKFKTTSTAIMTANNIADPAKLTIGKKLKIPSKEARSAKISEPAPATPAPAKEAAPTAQLANFVPQG